MEFWQQVILQFIGVAVGVVIGILGMTVKLGPRLSKVEMMVNSRIESGLTKQDLSDFENRFLERLNGRYLRTDLAKELIAGVSSRVERLEKDRDDGSD